MTLFICNLRFTIPTVLILIIYAQKQYTAHMQELSHPSLLVVDSVLDLVGNTPMLKMHTMDTGTCELFLKMESQNPGQSIKDRIAITMIEKAESCLLYKSDAAEE